MAQTLDYHRPSKRTPSRVLSFFAHLSAAYPLFLLGSLYGQWLLSWWMLGYCPRPSQDDPKYIEGASWMHLITFVFLIGFIPAGCGALAINILYLINHRVQGIRLLVRIGLGLMLWLGTFLLMRFDPGMVLYWWLD